MDTGSFVKTKTLVINLFGTLKWDLWPVVLAGFKTGNFFTKAINCDYN